MRVRTPCLARTLFKKGIMNRLDLENLTDTRDSLIMTLETRLAVAKQAQQLAENDRVKPYMILLPFVIGVLTGLLIAIELPDFMRTLL